MAFIKITELASNDNSITNDDLLTVVDMGTGQNRKMTIGAFRSWLDDRLGDHYTSTDFEQDLLDAGIVARLDSEHNWVISFVNGIDQSLSTKIDSEHAWNVNQHASLEASITAEVEARENADSDLLETVNSLVDNAGHYDKDNFDSDLLSSGLQAAVDSEHTWNVDQHSSLQSNIDDEATARSNADSDINVSLDSEHAWNAVQHASLQTNIDNETTARSNADSDLSASIDSEHAWNITQHESLQSSIDAEATARSDADSDLNASIDSEHTWNLSEHSNINIKLDSLQNYVDSYVAVEIGKLDSDLSELRDHVDSSFSVLEGNLDSEHSWNVSEHSSLQSNIDAEAVARSNADSDLTASIDSDRAWNVDQHSSLQSNIDAEATARSNADSDLTASIDSEHAWTMSLYNNLESDIDSSLDSEHAWNISEHAAEAIARSDADSAINVRIDTEVTARSNADSDLNASIDSEHAWNITQHDAEATARSNADSDLSASIDSEHAWNITQHDAEATARSNADSDLSASIDSEHAWNITQHDAEATARSNADSDINIRLDSEHAWNISQDSSLQSNIDAEATARSNADSDLESRLDSEHAWNVSQHDAEATTRSNADSDLNSSIDSEHAWNLAEHSSLQSSIDAEATARSNADSDLDARADSEHAWNVIQHDTEATARSNADSDLDARADSEHAWNVSQHDAESTARSNADSDLNARLDSEHAWNDSEHSALNARIGGLTTDDIAEGTSLYYTQSRLSSQIDSEITADFLNNRMSINNLSDVQIGNTVPLSADHFLQWNGSVWENAQLVVEQSIDFKGVVDVTTATAPVSPKNGDMWINSTSGVADNSWTGLSDVSSSQSIAYSSDQSMWFSLGGVTEAGVELVRAGLAISVNDSNAGQPTVAIDKSVTDTWYYEQAELDARLFWDSVAPQDITYKKSGKVGIGELVPEEKLHVTGNIYTKSEYNSTGTTNALVYFSSRENGDWRNSYVGNVGSSFVIGTGGLGSLDHTNAAQRVTITPSGNVGIGTASPSVPLEVNGIARVNSYLSLNNNGYIRGDAVGELRFQSGATATTFYDSTNNTERMRIDGSGNVGIGTTSPSTDLDVRNNISMGDGTAVTQLSMIRNSANYIAATNASGYLVFRTGGTNERMRIDASGNVGIGGTPSSALDLFRSSGYPTIKINATGGANGWVSLQHGVTTGASWLYSSGTLNLGSGGTAERVTINSSGNVGIGTASPAQKLHLSASSGSIYTQTTSGATQFYSGVASTGVGTVQSNTSLTFVTGSSYAERMRIDANGVVQGIWNNNGAGNADSQIRKLTQAQYDALTPDANTLYIIVG